MNLLLVLLVIVGIMAPALLFSGWVTMLCLGALSHIFGIAGLAIGFGPSVLVSLILSVLFGGSIAS